MPILNVEIVGEPEAREGLVQRIADAAADVVTYRKGGTWVRLRVLPEADYAEDGGAPEGVLPVFVSVLKRSVPEGPSLSNEIARLTIALAEACGRPQENVHIIYEPAAGGRIAFGGKLVPPAPEG